MSAFLLGRDRVASWDLGRGATLTEATKKRHHVPSAPATFRSGLGVPKRTGLARFLPRGPIPSDETCEWMFTVYGWLLSNLGGMDSFKETPLVLPTDEFFPVVRSGSSKQLAKGLFERALEHAGLQDWDLDIRPLQDVGSTAELFGAEVPFGLGAPRVGALSGIKVDGDRYIIEYAPHLLENSETFIAAIAYEFAHLLVAGFASETDLPGVDSVTGPLIEVAVTFLGFGVFSANSVFRLEGFQGNSTIGWNTSRLGELSEIEVSYALALFLALKDEPFANAKQYLRSNPRSYAKAALRSIRRDSAPGLAELRSISARS